MSYSNLSICCSVLLLVAVAAAQETGKASNDEYAVDIVTKHGNHIQFPYFMPHIKTIDPQLRALLVENAKAIMNEFGSTLNSRLTAKSGAFSFVKGYYEWSVLGTKLIKMSKAQESRKKKLANSSVGTKGKFNESVKAMFKTMMELSKKAAVQSAQEKRDNLRLAKEVEIILDDLKEAIEKSATAGYIKWNEGKVNGENFMDYTARTMGRLSNAGYGGVFTCVSGMLDMLAKFSG